MEVFERHKMVFLQIIDLVNRSKATTSESCNDPKAIGPKKFSWLSDLRDDRVRATVLFLKIMFSR